MRIKEKIKKKIIRQDYKICMIFMIVHGNPAICRLVEFGFGAAVRLYYYFIVLDIDAET